MERTVVDADPVPVCQLVTTIAMRQLHWVQDLFRDDGSSSHKMTINVSRATHNWKELVRPSD